jgi:glycosyltransferase involved in cell wall biosynthesis
MTLRVLYLLEDTRLWGGVKTVLRQADLLARRGHDVTILSLGSPPDWIKLRSKLIHVPDLEPSRFPTADVTVATHWTTLEPASAGASGEIAHYCQGFEGLFSHNRERRKDIESAYSRALPAMVVSLYLRHLLAERFGTPSRLVPQPLERFWRPSRLPRLRPGKRARILVPGLFESDLKGVKTALEAIARLRDRGLACQVIRISQWPLSQEEEEICAPDEYHQLLPPSKVAQLLRACDLLLAPNWEQEGFGLPALEAMASGIPVVATDVPCYRSWTRDAPILVPPRDPDAMADGAATALQRASRWRDMRNRGLLVAQDHTENRAAEGAEQALQWIASGAWKEEKS